MTSRRTAIAMLAAMAAAAAAPVRAARGHRARIYMLLPRPEGRVEQAFRSQLALQGIDAELVVRETDIGRVPAIVREARARGADLIYASGTALAEAVAGPPGAPDPARNVADIPIVFTASTLTPKEGAHLAAQRRNVTGIAAAIPVAAQFDAMLAYRPFERIATLANPASRPSMDLLDELRAEATARGLTLLERHLPRDVRGQPLAAPLPELIAALARQGAQLLYLPQDDWLTANRKAITDAALAQRLPCFAADDAVLRDARALFGVVSSADGMGRLAGHKAARILKDRVLPASLPVEGLPRRTIIVNMNVAATLGFYPPVALLNTAEILR
jgi:putative ABC transport system substrate-binding protein